MNALNLYILCAAILVSVLFKLDQLRGIQIRKLYEPQLFPNASMLPIFDKYFGPQTSG